MTELEAFYENQTPELREVYLALRQIILSEDDKISAEWKFKLPFFYYRGKMLCYLWYHKKIKLPYISFMDGNLINHPLLLKGDRVRARVLLIDPKKDLPIQLLKQLLKEGIKILDKKLKIKN